MEISTQIRNEKLAAINPDESYVLIKSYNGALQLKGTVLPLPENSSLRVPFSSLQLQAYQHLLVVENLDVFDVLLAYQLPMSGNTLLVYRGHDKATSKGVKSLLALAKNQTSVCWFPDLDPKGLQLALRYPEVDYILCANIETCCRELIKYSQSDKYQKQLTGITNIGEHELEQFVHQHKIATMQQHILSHGLSLKCYPARFS